ncbi:MAG: exodeoxyribonuclease VII large subunit [Thermodesulfobacteriota bacterium]|nr:exodeoxyribonuclease VII large subunit [Thermodesulfobacteriota bacterium]
MLHPSGLEILTVSEITHNIKLHLESNFDSVWVEGEISNLRFPPSGHVYFSLKDKNAQIRAVIFRSHIRFLKFDIKDGFEAICKGRITVYEPRGDYQLIIDYIEPKGVGALQLAYEQLKEKLRCEGLFDESNKKSLPLLPRKIGLVTSPTGAAVRDMIHVIHRRFPNVEIVIFPVRVQGEGSSFEIAHAIEDLDRISDLDVIITGRGGGSIEDLWSFNEEIVARAIYHCEIPVISAVGHEIDYTISDFVADLRAPTPSAAAELVVPNKSELINSLKQLNVRFEDSMSQIIINSRNRLDAYNTRLVDPTRMLDDFRLRLDDILGRLCIYASNRIRQRIDYFKRSLDHLFFNSPEQKVKKSRDTACRLDKEMEIHMKHYLETARQNFETLIKGLNSLSPMEILQRGYSITRRLPDRVIVKDAMSLNVGDNINVKVSRGEITGQVKAIKE